MCFIFNFFLETFPHLESYSQRVRKHQLDYNNLCLYKKKPIKIVNKLVNHLQHQIVNHANHLKKKTQIIFRFQLIFNYRIYHKKKFIQLQ